MIDVKEYTLAILLFVCVMPNSLPLSDVINVISAWQPSHSFPLIYSVNAPSVFHAAISPSGHIRPELPFYRG